jgi:hypothetical protein
VVDLTILMLTLNKLPAAWAEYHKQNLLIAAGDFPVITMSKEPLDWGVNVIQTKEAIGPGNSLRNIFRQYMIGAKMAETKYIAIAEDDTLYPKEHFADYRPSERAFAYNLISWKISSWGSPFYYFSGRVRNYAMVAPRELVIEALETRFARWPDGTEYDILKVDKELGVRDAGFGIEYFYTYTAIVTFNHVYSCDPTQIHRSKKPSHVIANDILYWGDAKTMQKRFG